ncbi:MAG: HipA domain-containing protein [Planctomycetota bacterium]|jgi:serine/threonine-protein kinase HipA|nr:HipA domain-containing protein [Planctomycetota bacterium]
MNRCLASLEPRDQEGINERAQHALANGRRRFPHVVEYTRSELVQYRIEHGRSMSISGVQDKISMVLERGTLKPTEAGGRYILKPIPRLDVPQFEQEVPANEHVCMLMARTLYSLKTAECSLVRMRDGELAYITRRFDYDGDEKVLQEDFCQLLNRSSETGGENYKYTGSYEEVGQAIANSCASAMVQLPEYLRLLLYSYLIGNGDLHLKNISLMTTKQGDYVLTPAYDILSSTLHLPNESRLALDLVDDSRKHSANYTANAFETGQCFIEMGERLGVNASTTVEKLDLLARKQSPAEQMIRRSYLTPEAQDRLIAIMRDRLKALAIV